MCTFCEDELVRKRQKAESGKAGRKPASAAGWKKSRTGLAFALLVVFLFGGAWLITRPWRATTRLLEFKYESLGELQTLLDAGAIVHAKDEDGRTALLLAAQWNMNPEVAVEVIKVLLAAGADVNAKDEYGRTALMFAKEKGHSEVIKLLQAAGAKE